MDHTITLAPLIEALVGLLAAALLALGSWAIKRLLGWLKLSEDEKVRDYLEAALNNGIEFARNRAAQRGAKLNEIAVRDEMVAEAANYVVQRVPDALKRFGIDPDGAHDMILARLPAPR